MSGESSSHPIQQTPEQESAQDWVDTVDSQKETDTEIKEFVDSWADNPVLYDTVRLGLWAAAKVVHRIPDNPIGEDWALLDEFENNYGNLSISEMLEMTDGLIKLSQLWESASKSDAVRRLEEAQQPDAFQQMFEEEVSCVGRVPMKIGVGLSWSS